MMKPGGRHGGNQRGQLGRANENIDGLRGSQRGLIHLRPEFLGLAPAQKAGPGVGHLPPEVAFFLPSAQSLSESGHLATSW